MITKCKNLIYATKFAKKKNNVAVFMFLFSDFFKLIFIYYIRGYNIFLIILLKNY